MYQFKVNFTIQLIHAEVHNRLGYNVSEEEELIVKILVRGTDPQNYSAVKVEFLSEKDFFFLYQHNCDHNSFSNLHEEQGLKFEFPQYLTTLIQLFNRARENPSVYKCNLQINELNDADFFFNQMLSFKTINLLSFKCYEFEPENEDINKHIKFRH